MVRGSPPRPSIASLHRESLCPYAPFFPGSYHRGLPSSFLPLPIFVLFPFLPANTSNQMKIIKRKFCLVYNRMSAAAARLPAPIALFLARPDHQWIMKTSYGRYSRHYRPTAPNASESVGRVRRRRRGTVGLGLAIIICRR